MSRPVQNYSSHLKEGHFLLIHSGIPLMWFGPLDSGRNRYQQGFQRGK